MTNLLDIINDLEAKAKAATPGPWHYGEEDRTVFAAKDTQVDPLQDYERCNSICTMSGGDGYDFVDFEATGAYIATCSPDTVLTLITALREAMDLAGYYADENLYEVKERIAQTEVGIVPYESADVDDGEKARAWLAKYAKGDK